VPILRVDNVTLQEVLPGVRQVAQASLVKKGYSRGKHVPTLTGLDTSQKIWANTLEFVMQCQNMFALPPNLGRQGLLQIPTPTRAEIAAAASVRAMFESVSAPALAQSALA
jgi:hypothetical protein